MIWPIKRFDGQMLWVFGRTAAEACDWAVLQTGVFLINLLIKFHSFSKMLFNYPTAKQLK